MSQDELLRIAACLEEHFPHSMAKAVVKRGKEQESCTRRITFKSRIYCCSWHLFHRSKEKKVVIGSYHFVFEDENCKIPEGMQEKFADICPDEYSHLVYGDRAGELAAVICIEDPTP